MDVLRKRITAEYPGSRKIGPKDMLLLCVKGMTNYIKDPGFLFSADDVTQLKNYFNLGKRWYFLEYTIFSATGQFLPIQDASQLAKDMLHSYRENHIESYNDAVAAILFNLCLSWLYRNEASESVKLLNSAQNEISNSRDPYISSRVYLLSEVFHYLGNKSQSSLGNIKTIESGLALYDHELWASDQQWLSKLHIVL